MDALDLSAVSNIGAWGFVAFVILAIFRGWMITPRMQQETTRIQDGRIDDKDSELAALRAERDDWKAASFAKDETIRIQAQQIVELHESARVTQKFVESISKAASNG